MRLLPMLLFWAPLLCTPLVWAPRCHAQELTLPDAPQPTTEAIVGVQTLAGWASDSIGSITGQVTDASGALVPEASITLTVDGAAGEQTTNTDSMGKFAFQGVSAGSFHLKVTAGGMQPGATTGTLHPGETLELPAIKLKLASQDTQVDVTFTREELGAAEVQAEEKQRLLGIIPNFSVAYDWNAPPMTTKQKYDVAWKLSIDPITVLFNAGLAGYQYVQADFPGYGYYPAGYLKRFGADMATGTIGTFLSGALLPEVFHQDPRYFWKGSGSFGSRLLYALSTVVICRNDRKDGHWMPNYSNVVGNFTAGAISNLYYPASSRQGVALTFENGLEATGLGAISSIMQEFVLHRFTPKLPPSVPASATGIAPPPNLPPGQVPKPASTPGPVPATASPPSGGGAAVVMARPSLSGKRRDAQNRL
jgi:hypothetical protein